MPAGIRYLTARERAVRAVVKNLRAITQENDYNTTINAVHRLRDIPERSDEPPEIFLMFDESEIQQRGTFLEQIHVPLEVWFVLHPAENPDMEYNFLLADIQRALSWATVIDDTQESCPREVQLTALTDKPFYKDQRDGQIFGRIRYDFHYWHLRRDPRLWDADDELFIADDF